MTLSATEPAADPSSVASAGQPQAAGSAAADALARLSAGDVLRVERGHAGPEELAAVTAVLLARAAAQPAAPAHSARPKAGWRRLERERGFHAPHSWRV